MKTIPKTNLCNVTIRYLLDSTAKGSYLSYCILNERQNIKYITTITKGKRNSWNALKKATSITNKGYQKNELNL